MMSKYLSVEFDVVVVFGLIMRDINSPVARARLTPEPPGPPFAADEQQSHGPRVQQKHTRIQEDWASVSMVNHGYWSRQFDDGKGYSRCVRTGGVVVHRDVETSTLVLPIARRELQMPCRLNLSNRLAMGCG